MDAFSLWQEFEYDQLTINKRQKTDMNYADAPYDIRLGVCTSENLKYFKKRKIGKSCRAKSDVIVDLYIKLVTERKTPVILMPTNENCMIVNQLLLQKTNSDYVKLVAVD
ncbi:hypothetical protein QYM36_007692 [Artemia franciscana]|uniref:Uncharacterized protein n=1 Tax=Artemia franciscana TaxID=6661 RepID=A0AA88LHA5_ARTSF|nr:hypothetical protein QYM36_007692 [Artemia franciscana]